MAEDKSKTSEPKETKKTVDMTVKDVTSSTVGSEVRIVNKNPREGKYIVIDNAGDFYLVDTGKLEFSYNHQKVSPSSLKDKPYSFDDELKGLNLAKGDKSINKNEAKAVLYYEGIVFKEDAPRMMQALRNRGIREKGN